MCIVVDNKCPLSGTNCSPLSPRRHFLWAQPCTFLKVYTCYKFHEKNFQKNEFNLSKKILSILDLFVESALYGCTDLLWVSCQSNFFYTCLTNISIIFRSSNKFLSYIFFKRFQNFFRVFLKLTSNFL